MSHRDLVVIGASAGGLQALSTIVRALPAGFRASVLIVMHASSNGQGLLPQILQRISPLPPAFATDGEVLAHGRIYVAPPDSQLIVGGNSLALVHGPRENGFRPAIDPLFRTAAREHGRRVIGIGRCARRAPPGAPHPRRFVQWRAGQRREAGRVGAAAGGGGGATGRSGGGEAGAEKAIGAKP